MSTTTPVQEHYDTSSVFVAVIGRPNVGKSSLTNLLVGEKVAIVTSKPQTTRTRITGVIFFLPIPSPPKNRLQRCIYVLSDHYDFDKDTDRLTLQLCEVYDKLRSFLLALLCGCILRYTPERPAEVKYTQPFCTYCT